MLITIIKDSRVSFFHKSKKKVKWNLDMFSFTFVRLEPAVLIQLIFLFGFYPNDNLRTLYRNAVSSLANLKLWLT